MTQRKSLGPAWDMPLQEEVKGMNTNLATLFLIIVGFVALCLGAGIVSAGEVVKFRLPKEKTVHLKDESTAKSYAQSLKKLGCDHRLDGHAGHFDLTMNCPKWRDAEFPDHSAAHKWQDWLKSLGFETKHEH